jgi:RNA polymerase sporulation-specific sigma factor
VSTDLAPARCFRGSVGSSDVSAHVASGLEDRCVGLSQAKRDGGDRPVAVGGQGAQVSERFLLARAQRGDRLAESLLIERYEWLVGWLSSRFFLPTGEASDIEQVARIGLCDAIHCWDPAQGVQFRRFAVMVIRRDILMLISTSRTHGHRSVNTALSFEDASPQRRDGPRRPLAEVLAAPARDAHEPVEVMLGRERLRTIVSGLSALSKYERGSLAMTFNGHNQQEISCKFASTPKSINNALQRARRKLRGRL